MKETKFKQTLVQTKKGSRHCEEHSDVAIQGGFKMTEVGMIPSDWEVKSVGQLTNVLTGFPFPGNTILENGNVRLLRGVNITEGQIRHSDDIDRFYSGNIESLREYALREDDLVIGMDGSKVGKNSAIIHKNESGNLLVQRVARLRVKNSKQPISYIFYFISSNNFIAYIDSLKTNSAIPHISPADIRNYTIPLPSKIEEQQRIASALSDIDTLIANLEKLIAKKKNIKQGAMQKLLTGKKRLPGFAKSNNTKMTELGEIPEDWEVKSLGEIAETFTGLTYSPENVYEHGTLVLRSSNIKNEQLCFEDNVFVQMPIPERAFVKENDILICVRNGSKALIGKSALIPKSAVGMAFGAFMTVLRSTSVNQNYLLYVWQSDFVQNQVTDNLGATINQITNADFKKFNVIISPNRQEQTAIANVLSSMDKEIETLNTKLEKYRNLKTAMMQQLLTGKIRLGEGLLK